MAHTISRFEALDRWRDRLRGGARTVISALPDLAPLYWNAVYLRGGLEGINGLLVTEKRRTIDLLRCFGAQIGPNCSIYGPLFLNSFTNYRNLSVGRHTHIGQCVFLDLGSELLIDEE